MKEEESGGGEDQKGEVGLRVEESDKLVQVFLHCHGHLRPK